MFQTKYKEGGDAEAGATDTFDLFLHLWFNSFGVMCSVTEMQSDAISM